MRILLAEDGQYGVIAYAQNCDAKIIIAAPVTVTLSHLVDQTGAKVQYSGVAIKLPSH